MPEEFHARGEGLAGLHHDFDKRTAKGVAIWVVSVSVPDTLLAERVVRLHSKY